VYDDKPGTQHYATIIGPCLFVGGCCCSTKFSIKDPGGQKIGEIVKTGTDNSI